MILLLSTALAGGFGLVAEVAPGASWSNNGGFLVRGNALRFDTGFFWGPYRGTLQYGRYTRAGLQIGARTSPLVRSQALEATLNVSPEFGRGIDLLKVGAYWKVSVGPTIRVEDEDVSDDQLVLGLLVRGTVGGVYWLNRNLGVSARLEGGPEWVEGESSSFTGGLALGVIGKLGFRTGKHDEEEDE